MESVGDQSMTVRRGFGRPRKYHNADERRAAKTEQRRMQRQAARARKMEPPAPTYFPGEQAAEVEPFLPPMSPPVNAAADLDDEQIQPGEEPPQLALDNTDARALGTSNHPVKFSYNNV